MNLLHPVHSVTARIGRDQGKIAFALYGGGDDWQQCSEDQRTFARTADAGNADQFSQRNVNGDVAKIMQGRIQDRKLLRDLNRSRLGRRTLLSTL